MARRKLQVVDTEQELLFRWDSPYVEGEFVERPKVRSECENGIRPCPFVSCQFHLYLTVNKATGLIRINHPGKEPEELEHSCALDEADQGEHTLEQIAEYMGLTRERVRQIEESAMEKLNERHPDLPEHLVHLHNKW